MQKATVSSALGYKERSKDKDLIGDIIVLAEAVGDSYTEGDYIVGLRITTDGDTPHRRRLYCWP